MRRGNASDALEDVKQGQCLCTRKQERGMLSGDGEDVGRTSKPWKKFSL